jgi:hypothetical protein
MLRTLSLGSVLALAVACGPGTGTDGTDGTDGSDGSDGSTAADSAESDDSDTGDGDDGQGSDDDGGEPVDCSEFDDELVDGPGAAIFIHNQTDAPIFLSGPGGCAMQHVHVDAQNGVFPNPGCSTCEGEGACAGCPKFCLWPPMVRIEAGGYFEILWDGTVYEPMTLAPECASEDCDNLNCRAEREAQAGPLVVTAYRFDETVCADPDDEHCQCEPGPTGACMPDAFGSEFAGIIQAQGELYYGADENVVVAFE